MDMNLNKEIGCENSTRNTDWLCLVVLLKIQLDGVVFCSDKASKLMHKTVMDSNLEKAF